MIFSPYCKNTDTMLPIEEFYKLFLDLARRIILEETGMYMRYKNAVLRNAVDAPHNHESMQKFCYYAIMTIIDGREHAYFNPLSDIFYGNDIDGQDICKLEQHVRHAIRTTYGKCYFRLLGELIKMKKDNIHLLK